jgi:virulence factor
MILIDKYKRLRSEAYLKETYDGSYAFVGLGQHSLSNLYPVIHYLQIPLKYICVTSEAKAALIGEKFRGVTATTDLDAVLSDPEIRGVFVAASPAAHFSIAQKVLKAGKALFVEKPPCSSAEELETLISLNKGIAAAGLQKRYAPAVHLLKKKLSHEKTISYDLHYCTGPYPEGNALTDLFIHPLDLVCHLFGPAEILSCRATGKDSYLLMLGHGDITGSLELSTQYSWTDARETLAVNTGSGLYELDRTERLTLRVKPAVIAGIPLEKAGLGKTGTKVLFEQNSFSPVLQQNQVYTQGFFDEIRAFAEKTQGRKAEILSDLPSLRDTYRLLYRISV